MGTLEHDLVAQGMELRETHISRVFLSADAAYKVKKAVALGFLDFTTLERRRACCEAEVSLNRRLAPDVYLGVLPIALVDGVHRIDGAGEPVEWAVHMRRLPDRDAADQRLREGRLTREHVRSLAELLARFHAGARCDAHTASFGSMAAIEANVRENFAQTRASALRHLSAGELLALQRFQLDFLRDHAALFSTRIERARVRDGHGDLRLEHCYLGDDGSARIIDCIEFNERFRYGDVCADLAFLAMDFGWHERTDLGEALLADYARESGDYDLYALADFYESYRAYVRGKVSGILEDDAGVSSTVRARAAAEARKYYLLAEACARQPLQQPALYAVGGVIATGKSTVAQVLAELAHGPVVDADRTRKRLSGVAETTPLRDAAFAGHYGREATAAVYAELLRCAEVILRSGRPVVLDASFRAREHRLAALELARRLGARFMFVECSAPAQVCRERLARRARGPSISDGREDIFGAFVASYEPVEELPAAVHLRLDTARPVDSVRADLAGLVA